MVCPEQFREDIALFTVHLWDFVGEMHGWAILAVAFHVLHPSDILETYK